MEGARQRGTHHHERLGLQGRRRSGRLRAGRTASMLVRGVFQVDTARIHCASDLDPRDTTQ
jgi:hypothetical protein